MTEKKNGLIAHPCKSMFTVHVLRGVYNLTTCSCY